VLAVLVHHLVLLMELAVEIPFFPQLLQMAAAAAVLKALHRTE
jgi:hypothetical protein